MRTSVQRDLILSIVNNSCEHLTVDEIYQIAKVDIKNISLGTVYRNLNQLYEKNLIRKIKCDNKVDRYDNNSIKHSHFICKECGMIEDMNDTVDCNNKTINNNLITEYDLVFKGICSICLKKEE